MREWLSGGAPPCQGGGRGFDPRLALEKERYRIGIVFFSSPARARRFDVYAPLRSAQAEVPRTSCAVSRFFHAVAGLHPPAPSRFITNKVKKGGILSSSACLHSRTPASIRTVGGIWYHIVLLPLINDEWEPLGFPFEFTSLIYNYCAIFINR